eukprot:6535876-Prymnesium_polylepis.1
MRTRRRARRDPRARRTCARPLGPGAARLCASPFAPALLCVHGILHVLPAGRRTPVCYHITDGSPMVMRPPRDRKGPMWKALTAGSDALLRDTLASLAVQNFI